MTTLPENFFPHLLRAIGFIDLNPLSPTAGCCDRGYWHYQDGKGYAVGSFQVATLAFAAGAEYLGETPNAFQDAVPLALTWWTTQIKNGRGLDEYFLGQRSFCASSHSTLVAAIIIEQRRRLGQAVDPAWQSAIHSSLKYLSEQKHRPTSANQALAARLAWDLTYPDRTSPFEAPHHPGEGWLSEYGGFDLGYSLQCVDLCAAALLTLNSTSKRAYYETLLQALLPFLNHVVVEYTFSVNLSTRGNPHAFTGGLTALSKSGSPMAQAILEALECRFSKHLVPAAQADDKYFAFFHLFSQVLDSHANRPLISLFPEVLPAIRPTINRSVETKWHLPHAQLQFLKAGNATSAIRLCANGACVIETDRGFTTFGGYLAVVEKTKCKAEFEEAASPTTYEFTQNFYWTPVASRHRLSQSLVFRLSLAVALKIPILRDWLNALILNRVTKPPALEKKGGTRRIDLSSGIPVIRDEFESNVDALYILRDWNLTDGHSTRQHADASPCLEAKGHIVAGTSLFPVGAVETPLPLSKAKAA